MTRTRYARLVCDSHAHASGCAKLLGARTGRKREQKHVILDTPLTYAEVRPKLGVLWAGARLADLVTEENHDD